MRRIHRSGRRLLVLIASLAVVAVLVGAVAFSGGMFAARELVAVSWEGTRCVGGRIIVNVSNVGEAILRSPDGFVAASVGGFDARDELRLTEVYPGAATSLLDTFCYDEVRQVFNRTCAGDVRVVLITGDDVENIVLHCG